MYNNVSLESITLSAENFPRARDRSFFESIPEEVRAVYAADARELIGAPWPQVKYTDCLEFNRSGDRALMENPHFGKRRRLTRLVAAECFEYTGGIPR